jgi:hypothetical protein
MLRRRRPNSELRTIVGPLADRVGLNGAVAFLTPPKSEDELALAAVHCCFELLASFMDVEQWPSDRWGWPGISKREARRAATYLYSALRTTQGCDALVVMTSGYGRVIADYWRRTTQAIPFEYADSANELTVNAAASDELADLVALKFPLDQPYDAVLEEVAHAEQHRVYGPAQVAQAEQQRFYGPHNPNAVVDLGYAARVRAHADALAVAMFERFDEFAEAIIGPVAGYHVVYDDVISGQWARTLRSWWPLLHPNPPSRADLIRREFA